MPTDQLGHVPVDWAPSALASIGAATILTDAHGLVTFLNPIAESLTGWPQREAAGQPVTAIFKILNERTRQPVTNPISTVLTTGVAVGLSNHIILIGRDGTEWVLDDGAAPIRDRRGAIVGAVLIFRDVTDRRRAEQVIEEARAFAEGIVETVREPLVVLDGDLRVRIANRSFYDTFRTDPVETEGKLLFDLGNGQWGIPHLRKLLDDVLTRGSLFNDFEVDHDFAQIGRRVMILNARRLAPVGNGLALILLAMEDATQQRKGVEALAVSEARYRRLFETAQDGILLVDPMTGKIFDANPFLTDLLGYLLHELIGKELWEIGLFRDVEASKVAFQTLRDAGYIRYDDLPLRTHDDREIAVEFVSNVYSVGDARVIQCNIRDVTDRKQAEDALRGLNDELEHRVQDRTAELARTNAALTEEIVRRREVEAERRHLQQLLTTAQEDERRRIARELHDQMGQHLAALGLGLKVAKDATPDPSPTHDKLQQLQNLTDIIGREVHHLALELRPTALDDLGLATALANYAEGWSERASIEVDFHATGPDGERLPIPVETALYRVVQEALRNVLRHANALKVSVVLQWSSGEVVAVVEDDGGGFDVESNIAIRQRLGMLGMRERVELVGGSLTVESAPGRGTTVIARVPLWNVQGGSHDHSIAHFPGG